jgi:hypothetical protein
MTEPETPLEDRAKPATGLHPVNIGHLVMGTALVGLFAVWALISSDTVELGDAHWLLPAPWLVAGLVGLVATVLRNTGRRNGKMSGWI